MGYLAPSATGELSNSSVKDFNFTVTVQQFKEAVGYGEFVFNTSGAELVYDGYFHVQEK